MADPFRRTARELGLQTELFAYDAEAASFGPLAERVANAGPDGVFVLGSIDEGGDRLVRALRSEAGDDVTIHVLDLFGPVPYVLEKLGSAAHGIYMSATDTPPHALDLSPAGERFARDFGYLDNPTPYVLPAAQAAESVLEAIARSDGTRRSVLARLRATEVEEGILGSFRLDPFGDINPGRIPIFRITGQEHARRAGLRDLRGRRRGPRDHGPVELTAQGRIGAASWIFRGAIGTPSLHLPLERCLARVAEAVLAPGPVVAQLRRASHDFQQKFQS